MSGTSKKAGLVLIPAVGLLLMPLLRQIDPQASLLGLSGDYWKGVLMGVYGAACIVAIVTLVKEARRG